MCSLFGIFPIILFLILSTGEAFPPPVEGGLEILQLRSSEGLIEIGLDSEAAPNAIRQLRRLVSGPVFDPEIRSSQAPVEGYYDGLSFDHAIPGHEISTSIRPPAPSIRIPGEIDAVSLGLESRYLSSPGEAMDLWQFEIMREMTRTKGPPPEGSRLSKWLAMWKEKGSAEFLLKYSQKEINEGLGYRYQDGLKSIPIRRGVVSLSPLDKNSCTPGLIIYLNDRPELDGRRTAIGRVRKGLERCDAISKRPLIPGRADQFRPIAPIRIFKATIALDTGSRTAPENRQKQETRPGGSS